MSTISRSSGQTVTYSSDACRQSVAAGAEAFRADAVRVVAEGVEDDETLHILRRYGCDLAQGCVVSPPLTSRQFGEWLGRRPPNEFTYLDDRYAEELAAYSGATGTVATGPGDSAAVETPIGIRTAFVGAPLFLWLLARGRHGWA